MLQIFASILIFELLAMPYLNWRIGVNENNQPKSKGNIREDWRKDDRRRNK